MQFSYSHFIDEETKFTDMYVTDYYFIREFLKKRITLGTFYYMHADNYFEQIFWRKYATLFIQI